MRTIKRKKTEICDYCFTNMLEHKSQQPGRNKSWTAWEPVDELDFRKCRCGPEFPCRDQTCRYYYKEVA